MQIQCFLSGFRAFGKFVVFVHSLVQQLKKQIRAGVICNLTYGVQNNSWYCVLCGCGGEGGNELPQSEISE